MIGFIATILLAIAYMPQLISIIKTKKVEGISVTTYVFLIIGLSLWCYHAWTHKDWALLVSSSISLLQSIIIVLYLKNDKKNQTLHNEVFSKIKN